MSSPAVSEDPADDRYFTQIEAGDVRLFTLDQLDAAFSVGLIHENTYVCREGDSRWLTLAEVAGLADEAEPPLASSILSAPPLYSASPRVGSTSLAPESGSSAVHSVVPTAMSVAPADTAASFGDDADLLAMRPQRRLGKLFFGLGGLGVAALVAGVAHRGGLPAREVAPTDGAGQVSAASPSHLGVKGAPVSTSVQTPTALKVGATPEPGPGASESGDGASEKSDQRLSEELKAALLEKDKKQALGRKHKKASRAATSAKRHPVKGSPGFKSGGSVDDPLNGKL